MFLKQLMQAPQPGSRGAQFGSAMGEMAPLLFSMAQGLRSGQGASAYAPQGLAAMMYQQQLADEKADKQRKEREAKASQAAAERMVAESLGMFGGGGGYDENAVRNSAMAANGGPTNAAGRAMDLGPQIEETAAAIGMDPVDLATIISYETGGTFDPAKAGPTTQWGQHRGFIQFGEPQARQYGVDWNDPIGSQLGADGAVARYFKENGWKPGMGMLDAYSIVNAGAPGRYSAKDVQNGGAPGTVADKVNTQMAGHRRRAEAMFPQQQKPRVSPERAAQILANPNVPAAVKNMVAAQFMPQEPKDRDMKQDANGRWRYTDTGDLVFPGVEVMPKGDDQRTRKITDAQRLYGMDEQTATALVDGFIKVVPDQLGGFNVVDMRKELQPQAEAQPEQPDQGTIPPLSFNLPGVNDSFGIEGFGKGLLNTGADIVGAPVPFADVQDAQSDFGVLREDILSDLANGYRRQPPSWVLQALDDLTPKAGSPIEGSQKAQSKLRALDRKFEREISLSQQQLRRRMKPTDRAEIEGQLTSLQAARARVQGMLGAFGGSGGGGIPQLFIDSVGELPEGLTADDVWAEMSEDEKAAFQQ